MFEVGLKSEFFDHHVRFNIAGYTGVYKDQQVDFSVPYYCFNAQVPSSSPARATRASSTRTTTNTYNTPDARQGERHRDRASRSRRSAGLTLSAAYTSMPMCGSAPR